MPEYSSKIHLILVRLMLLAGTLSGCGPSEVGRAEIEVTGAWLRPPVIAGRPAAGYMTISNSGDRGDVLSEATSGQAGRITLHRSQREDGIARMLALDEVPVPPRSKVEFEPGGTHLMIFGLEDQTLQDGIVELTLHFKVSGDLAVTFRVGEEETQ